MTSADNCRMSRTARRSKRVSLTPFAPPAPGGIFWRVPHRGIRTEQSIPLWAFSSRQTPFPCRAWPFSVLAKMLSASPSLPEASFPSSSDAPHLGFLHFCLQSSHANIHRTPVCAHLCGYVRLTLKNIFRANVDCPSRIPKPAASNRQASNRALCPPRIPSSLPGLREPPSNAASLRLIVCNSKNVEKHPFDPHRLACTSRRKKIFHPDFQHFFPSAPLLPHRVTVWTSPTTGPRRSLNSPSRKPIAKPSASSGDSPGLHWPCKTH